jgi:hypothetical protein
MFFKKEGYMKIFVLCLLIVGLVVFEVVRWFQRKKEIRIEELRKDGSEYKSNWHLDKIREIRFGGRLELVFLLLLVFRLIGAVLISFK